MTSTVKFKFISRGMKQLTLLAMLAVCSGAQAATETAAVVDEGVYPDSCPAIFHHTMKQLHSSNMLNLCDVTNGHPVLLVNTASHCGFTDQFGDLQKINDKYKDKGLVVIGVSSDSFNQEADDEAEAADVCFKNFGVSFTMLATVPVKGSNAHPLFKEVAEQDTAPKWNFYKYLIDPSGKIVKSHSSFKVPSDKEIESLLQL
ncbi:glutathione peroxidase [Thalassolituus oleivorans]|jgi:glutathione peroxidase|uniref:glutathione peroxidase n=1 Tax=Thalassolituus oleivorans TaxID=187493 RepID=UPI001B3E2027|nr:redoxin domain-containing protein [Thalassolituus oleivorans]MBQ0728911.1 redoxin domain-containing protein [Thalassolituus oleivorans]MBQ0782060.1 redoxin domain-containing protein [Thalassolituus oleivorans]MDF1640514.1 redoxin domain-containing protein [Thalassolituus oleivorans]